MGSAAARASSTVQEPGAGQQRHAVFGGDAAGGVLQAEGAHLVGRGADEDDAGSVAGFGEVGVLAEEAVAGMDGFGAGRRAASRSAAMER